MTMFLREVAEGIFAVYVGRGPGKRILCLGVFALDDKQQAEMNGFREQENER